MIDIKTSIFSGLTTSLFESEGFQEAMAAQLPGLKEKALVGLRASAQAVSAGVYRGLAIRAFQYVMKESPQATGHFVANWNLTVSDPDDTVHDMSFFTDTDEATIQKFPGGGWIFVPSYSKAHRNMDAIRAATARARSTFKSKLLRYPGSTSLEPVYITNGVDYGEYLEKDFGPKDWGGSMKSNFLRPENKPGHMMARANAYLTSQYGTLSPGAISELVKARVVWRGV